MRRPETPARVLALVVCLLPLGLLAGGCARATTFSIVGNPIDDPPDDDPGNDPIDPPTGPSDFVPLAGLVSAAAGPSTVRVDWRRPQETVEGETYELALFSSPDRGTVFGGAPLAAPLTGTSLVLSGLTDGQELFFGLGIREAAVGGAFEPTGVVVVATPGPVLFVDFASTAMNPDGLSPATAFADPFRAILTAGFVGGGGNVWCRAGTYADVANIPLVAGTHVYGGFGPDFSLDTRDLSNDTTWVATAAPTNITVGIQHLATTDPAAIGVLDGIVLDGGGIALAGLEVDESSAELRSVTVRDFAQRGVRLQSQASEEFDIVLAGSSFVSNGAEGLDGIGPFDLRVDGCEFNSNIQEGLNLDDLVAPPGESISLSITSSRFFGNGSEGLDVDLNVPLLVVDLSGGEFSIDIRGCAFERNGLDGALIDIEYELFPNWSAEILVRESVFRGNGLNGLQLDLDAATTFLGHRLASNGNDADGYRIASESDAGVAFFSSCVAAANGGAGFRNTGSPAGPGNRSVALSHTIVAGNLGGGVHSDTALSTVVSSASHLQANAATGAVIISSSGAVTDPAQTGFVNAPIEYVLATGPVDPPADPLVLAQVPAFAPGAFLELADDGVTRTASTVVDETVTLDPVPEILVVPDTLCVFETDNVVEDYRAFPGGLFSGVGFRAPGAPAVDVGVFGAPAGGSAGFADVLAAPLFHPVGVTPAPALGIGALQDVEVTFSAALDPASVTLSTVRVLVGGSEVSAGTLVTPEGRLVVSPPAGGWGIDRLNLQLHVGLRSAAGVELSAPFQVSVPISG